MFSLKSNKIILCLLLSYLWNTWTWWIVAYRRSLPKVAWLLFQLLKSRLNANSTLAIFARTTKGKRLFLDLKLALWFIIYEAFQSTSRIYIVIRNVYLAKIITSSHLNAFDLTFGSLLNKKSTQFSSFIFKSQGTPKKSSIRFFQFFISRPSNFMGHPFYRFLTAKLNTRPSNKLN